MKSVKICLPALTRTVLVPSPSNTSFITKITRNPVRKPMHAWFVAIEKRKGIEPNRNPKRNRRIRYSDRHTSIYGKKLMSTMLTYENAQATDGKDTIIPDNNSTSGVRCILKKAPIKHAEMLK
jgi:hypothetical protein